MILLKFRTLYRILYIYILGNPKVGKKMCNAICEIYPAKLLQL